jgi:hypothetical protein
MLFYISCITHCFPLVYAYIHVTEDLTPGVLC